MDKPVFALTVFIFIKMFINNLANALLPQLKTQSGMVLKKVSLLGLSLTVKLLKNHNHCFADTLKRGQHCFVAEIMTKRVRTSSNLPLLAMFQLIAISLKKKYLACCTLVILKMKMKWCIGLLIPFM